MVQQSHNFELAECSKRKHLMLESFFNFFDGHKIIVFIFYGRVLGRDDDTVGTRANWIDDFILDWQLEA